MQYHSCEEKHNHKAASELHFIDWVLASILLSSFRNRLMDWQMVTHFPFAQNRLAGCCGAAARSQFTSSLS
jgi:hypothetical protein